MMVDNIIDSGEFEDEKKIINAIIGIEGADVKFAKRRLSRAVDECKSMMKRGYDDAVAKFGKSAVEAFNIGISELDNYDEIESYCDALEQHICDEIGKMAGIYIEFEESEPVITKFTTLLMIKTSDGENFDIGLTDTAIKNIKLFIFLRNTVILTRSVT